MLLLLVLVGASLGLRNNKQMAAFDQMFIKFTTLGLVDLVLTVGLIGLFWGIFRFVVRYHEDKMKTLRESAAFLRSTLDALSARIAVLDGAGKIVAANRSWRDSGTAGTQVIAHGNEGENYLALCDTLRGQGRAIAADIGDSIRAVSAGQRDEAINEYSDTVGEQVRWFLCRITRFPGGGDTRVVTSHEDITARKHAEEAATNAKRAADAANQAKSAFLANMSHEIRTPMTAILGYGDLLLQSNQAPAERERCVQVIRRNGEHLLGLINDVLDISKIEADKCDVERVKTDLRQLLADVVALTRVRAIQKGLNFKVVIDGPVPKDIETDPLRLKQILINLIGNAVKFTSTGGIHLRVSFQGRVVGSLLNFEVIDSGIGMSAEQRGKLFRPFAQADESTTRKFGGTGLGLFISKRFAQMLGGDISVQSDEGAGTCFCLWVDVGSVNGVRMLASLTEEDLVNHVGAAHTVPQKFIGTVLVAEDGEDNQQLISLLLRNAGINVVMAPNGKAAVAAATSRLFDVILMDMQMPELDGYGATRKLRENNYRKPIVALTANAMADDRTRCLDAGCDDYLPKPIRVEQLMHTLSRYLKAAPSDQQGAGMPDTIDESQRLRSSLAGNEKLRSVLDRFVARLPERVREMQDMVRDHEMDNLARVVHQMKGAAGGYGFPEITAAASRAEQSIKRSDDVESICEQIDELVGLIRRVDGFPVNSIPALSAANASVEIAEIEKETRAAEIGTAAHLAPSHAGPLVSAKTRVDPVTGLPNHNHLMERLSVAIATARREAASLSCIVVHLDELETVASRYSQDVAHAILKRIATILEERCKGDGEVFRSELTRLALVMPRTGIATAENLANELAQLIVEERFADLVGDWKLSCIFGVSQLEIRTPAAADLLASAVEPIEQALAKRVPVRTL